MSKQEQKRALLRSVLPADKKTCVFLVNRTNVHYNLNVKGFRKLELRGRPLHPL
jgi:hypothetical protein